MDALFFLLITGLAIACTLASRRLFHYYQLENYQFRGYLHTTVRNWKKTCFPGLVLALAVTVILLDTNVMAQYPVLAVCFCLAAMICAGLLLRRSAARAAEKKPFVLTVRMKRLYAVTFLVHLLLLTVLCALCGLPSGMALLCCSLPAMPVVCIYPLLLPVWVLAAAFVAWPMELLIRHLYFRDAQRVLRQRTDLVKIGITGSYGKTSVKFILATILSEKYQVCATPSSYNTPMGLSRVIRGQLRPAHQIFIAEMGARHRGDIRELCRLVHPSYGVLTSVGEQHLETFKTLENIKKTKYDLIRSLPKDGVAFFLEDGGICRELYDGTEKEKRLASLHKVDGSSVWAEDVNVSPAGSTFTLCTPGEKVTCETRLLGEHNIKNLLLAATVALELGLSLKEIRRGISRVRPVEHRLQLIPSADGITVIDDAFNANPHGTDAALQVLKAFPSSRIVVTPGMVELGEDEEALNRTFGEHMAACADQVILIGPRHTAPIRDGLLSAGFDEQQVHTVASLQEARQHLAQLAHAGDTVLFENDLPDNYSEN